MSTPPIKIYYPSQYPAGVSPSQRFRIEQYIPFLKKESIHFNVGKKLKREKSRGNKKVTHKKCALSEE